MKMLGLSYYKNGKKNGIENQCYKRKVMFLLGKLDPRRQQKGVFLHHVGRKLKSCI